MISEKINYAEQYPALIYIIKGVYTKGCFVNTKFSQYYTVRIVSIPINHLL
jgi:hypothetical protein